MIYSGEGRSLDIGYLNPIGSHLEIELNNRLNVISTFNANAVWQIHVDYLLLKNIRISFNLLYDEFVFDPDLEINKDTGKAVSSKIAYSPFAANKNILTIYANFIKVGSPTFRHYNGDNNFIKNSKPLGWENGSDLEEISVGFNFLKSNKVIISSSYGYLNYGEQNILSNGYEPFDDYLKGPFPSGKVSSFSKKTLMCMWQKTENLSLNMETKVTENLNNEKKYIIFSFSINYSLNI